MKILESISSAKWWLIGGAVAITVAAIGVGVIYNKGYDSGLAVSQTKIAQYEVRVRELNNKLLDADSKVTTEVVTEYLDRYINRDRIVYVNRDIIVDRVPEQYQLSAGWVYAHDQAAQSLQIDAQTASNPTPSEVSDTEALTVVADNYGQCNAVADQLIALQEWNKQIAQTRIDLNRE